VQVGDRSYPRGSHGFILGEPASDLEALHQCVDIALSLSFPEAVLGSTLRHKIIVALERGQILLGEFARFALTSLRTICLVSAAVQVSQSTH
jgi:hypothetical protein